MNGTQEMYFWLFMLCGVICFIKVYRVMDEWQVEQRANKRMKQEKEWREKHDKRN